MTQADEKQALLEKWRVQEFKKSLKSHRIPTIDTFASNEKVRFVLAKHFEEAVYSILD